MKIIEIQAEPTYYIMPPRFHNDAKINGASTWISSVPFRQNGIDSIAVYIHPPASEWVKVDERLPDLGAPVWLALENGSIIIGCRADEGDGWLWEKCFSMPWINAKSVWECYAEMDDHYEVTHWRELPAPLPIEVTG